MKAIVIANFIITLYLFFIHIKRVNRLSVNVLRTFWFKRAYGIEAVWWKNPKTWHSNSGKIFFTFCWTDFEKAQEKDSTDKKLSHDRAKRRYNWKLTKEK